MNKKATPVFFQRNDRLFKSGSYNAFLDYSPQQKSEAYVLGYKYAAEVILNEARKGYHIDLLLYPSIYLYRHYIELRMKSLVEKGGQLIEEYRDYPIGHDIEKTWITLRRIVKEVLIVLDQEESVPEADLKIMDRLMKELSALDRSSQAFRYHIDARRNRTLKGITHIDLANFFEVVERISDFLEGMYSYIDDNLQQKLDMMDELGLIPSKLKHPMKRKFRRTKD